jgi:hypothetical protein
MVRRVLFAVFLVLALALGVAGAALGQDSPESPLPLPGDTPLSGSTVGSNAGSFDYYAIDYPGDERVVRIVVRFAPGDPATLAGVVFNVYGPAGFHIGESSPTGDQDGREDLSYSESADTTWLVQVFNYIDSVTVSYTITAEGLPAPTPTPATPAPGITPTPTPVAPDAVRGLEEPVSDTLAGNRAGAFDRYQIVYPGDNSEVTVTMTFAPDNPVIQEGVGFTIYGPEGQEFVAQPTGTPGERRVTLASDVAGTYLVQVHNYIEGLTVGYTIGR